MKIIGAGFGRTGTLSLKVALEELGFGPCYHFLEVIKHPGHIKHWQAAADGESVDWDALFKGYQSGVDFPVSGFYKELLAVYPGAKVILTTRDPNRWYESTLETIYKGVALPDWLTQILPPYKGIIRMVKASTWDRLFHGRFEDREYALRVFAEHNQEVKRFIPPDRLLIFEVRDGWAPLCAFLGVPVPNKPFPHVNDRAFTKRMYLLARVGAAVLALIVFSSLVLLAASIF